jgi:DNA-binding beta-propeller fold protein YncE
MLRSSRAHLALTCGVVAVPLLLALSLGFGQATPNPAAAVTIPSFEVWVMDQSDSTEDGGGTLYIYPGDPLTADAAAVEPEVIDLGGAARSRCLEQTGVAPKRPHMLLFNAAHSHAIVTFVATGHVLFMEAASRTPVACLDVGEQAHAAYPSPDETFVVVANQNGKLLQRISTDYATDAFVLDEGATLNLATCVTPSEAACEDPELRPDNAPICPIVTSDGRFTAVTLRGGGLFVVDNAATPLAIVAEYDRRTIRPNGCGGLETGGKLYLTAGGGTNLAPYAADLYVFPVAAFATTASPPNSPAPTTIFRYGEGADAHGAVLTGDGAYVWIADRAANRVIVVATATDEVVDEIDLTGDLTADPAPDLMDVSPDGAWVFLALRGPTPLTANVEGVDNAVGASPGLGVVQVGADGRTGELVGLAAISHPGDSGELADPHGVRVRPT